MPVDNCALCASAIDRRHGHGVTCAGPCGRRYHVRCTDPPLAQHSVNEVLFGSSVWHCRLCMENSHSSSLAARSGTAGNSLVESGTADITINALLARLCKVESLCEALVEENGRLRQQMSECLGLKTSIRAIEFRLDTVGSWSMMTPGPVPNRNRFVDNRLESTMLNERGSLDGNHRDSVECIIAPSEPKSASVAAGDLDSAGAGLPPLSIVPAPTRHGVGNAGRPLARLERIGCHVSNTGPGRAGHSLADGAPPQQGYDHERVLVGQAKFTNGLPTSQRFRWLFLARLSRQVTENQLSQTLSERLSSKRLPKCICLTKNASDSRKSASFRVALTDIEFDEANNPWFWEEGILVKPFLFRPGRKKPGAKVESLPSARNAEDTSSDPVA